MGRNYCQWMHSRFGNYCQMNIDVKTLATLPVKSIKTHPGEKGRVINFGGIQFVPGHWVHVDEV
jgi:regulator of RNase E activity RraA